MTNNRYGANSAKRDAKILVANVGVSRQSEYV